MIMRVMRRASPGLASPERSHRSASAPLVERWVGWARGWAPGRSGALLRPHVPVSAAGCPRGERVGRRAALGRGAARCPRPGVVHQLVGVALLVAHARELQAGERQQQLAASGVHRRVPRAAHADERPAAMSSEQLTTV